MSELFGEEGDHPKTNKKDATNKRNSLDSQEDTRKGSKTKNGKQKERKVAQVVVEDCESAGSSAEKEQGRSKH